MTYVNRVFLGSSENMNAIPDGVVHTCVTSPPYYGLRDYGTARWEGGNPDCEHRSPTMREGRNEDRQVLDGSPATNAHQLIRFANMPCGKCGAVRVDEQIGLEQTPDEYISRIVAVFREVRRVLRDDGTAWLNLGDSYFGDSPVRKASSESFSKEWDKTLTRSRGGSRRSAASIDGMKAKDLMLIPHRVAIALQQDGWWVRDDIVWCKPNPMPSSVNDRCTPCKEYVFQLAKSRRYYADMASVKEPLKEPDAAGIPIGGKKLAGGDNATYSGNLYDASTMQGANLRNVWTIATEPYAGAHFATMPRELVRRCVLIGSPPNGLVLDPFMGSGTVAEVALGCGRSYVGYELNPKYHDLIQDRLGLFGEGVA